MYQFFQTIKVICFWGMIFLLFLMIAFGIGCNDLWTELLSGNINMQIISGFLLFSPLLYIIIAVIQFIQALKDGQFFFHHIGSSLLPNFWPIYKFFDFRDTELGHKIYFLIQAILWWGISIYGVWTILTVEGNSIIQKIYKFDDQQILIRISYFLGLCFVLYIISFILMLIMFKLLRKDMDKYGI